MKKRMIVVAAVAFVCCAHVKPSCAWWSVPYYYSGGNSTHYNLASTAVSLLDTAMYPDIFKYRYLNPQVDMGIIPWMSGGVDDANAHGKKYEQEHGVIAADYDGGPIARWWGINSPDFNYPNDGVLPQYKAFNFANGDYSAYYYLALMSHLVTDQAVPAHAANIRHISPAVDMFFPPFYGDNLENGASTQEPQQCMLCHTTPPIKTIVIESIIDYYSSPSEGITANTQYGMPTWKDSDGQAYWIASKDYNGAAYDDDWGHYGVLVNEGDPANPLDYRDNYDKSKDTQNIVQNQLTSAVHYMSGLLAAASKKLPPLVRNFEIPLASEPIPQIDMVHGTSIGFQVLENRDPIVSLTIRAFSKTSPFKEYVVRPRFLLILDPGVDLPYERAFTLNEWKGECADGITLPDGKYTMRIEVEDFDGNEVNAVFPDINSDDVSGNNTAHDFEIISAPPGKPAALKIETGNATARLTWTRPVTNQDGSALTDLKNYLVYYSTSAPGDPYAQVTEAISPTGMEQEAFDFEPLINGVTYFVSVRAVDAEGNLGESSDWVGTKPMDAIWVHEGEKISDALAGAGFGDVVMVGPGTYHENSLIMPGGVAGWAPMRITLMSERGPGVTIIDGGGSSDITMQISDRSRVIGFTIRNGNSRGINCSFDEDVLIANNIFIANYVGVGVGGMGSAPPGNPVRIYNNVFDGNFEGIGGYWNFNGLLDVRDNIFVGNNTGIYQEYSYGLSAEFNDFFGNKDNVVSDQGYAVRRVYSCDPRFKGFIPSRPEDYYHLEEGSTCAVDKGDNFDYLDETAGTRIRWEDCAGVVGNGVDTDLGAYGGPYAFIDKNENHVPDCEEPAGYVTSVRMLKNSADQPITLMARNQPRTVQLSGSQALPTYALQDQALEYTIVTPPMHGRLSGAAPDLLYTVDPEYVGADGFTFTVANQFGASDPTPVSISVRDVNLPPVVTSQTIRVDPNAAGTILLLGGDAEGDPLTFTLDSSPDSGTLSCLHLPECNYFPIETLGAVSFTYHASDGLADSGLATVTIIVNTEPIIGLSSPAAAEPATSASSFPIVWSDDDPEDDASIALYYDTDAEGYHGSLIAADISEDDPADRFVWDTAGLPDGVYYIYAVIHDAYSTSRAYAPGPLVIDRVPLAVAIDPVPNPLLQSSVSLAGTMEAGAIVTLTADRPATIDTVDYPSIDTWSCRVSGLTDGPVSFTVTAVDAAGLIAMATAGTTVLLNRPPVLDQIGNKMVSENQQFDFAVSASDPDGTSPAITAAPLPANATFDGVSFSWKPGSDQAGTYMVKFTADDGGLLDTETVTITVLDVNRAPTVPVVLAPRIQGEVATSRPALEVESSTDPDGDPLLYEYEVYSDAGLALILFGSGPVPEADGGTSWQVTAELADNTWYWWRVRAGDGRSFSQWTEGAPFFVNLANDPPGRFAISEPQQNSEVASRTPVLGVTNSMDTDGDRMTYSFFVYADAGMTQLEASVAEMPAGIGGVTSWVVDPALADNAGHYWKSVATDEHGAATETTGAAFFINMTNDAPSVPMVQFPPGGAEVAAPDVTVAVGNATDLDYDQLVYFFEMDTVPTFDNAGRFLSAIVPEGDGVTAWSLSGLTDNTPYYWRARASDGLAYSAWTTSAFFTNSANDPPSTVVVRNPGAGAWVDSVTPRLEIYPAGDLDGDQLSYSYQISTEPPAGTIAQGLTADIGWVSDQTLEDNTWYTWRAMANDVHGLAGSWSDFTRFFVNNNGIDDPPSITITQPGTGSLTSGETFEISWADTDPDSDADIALYRDTNSSDADGILIADGIKEDPDGMGDRYQWDLRGVPPGTWWIYGVVRDATGTSVSYGLGSVTIDSQAPTTTLSPAPGTYTGAVSVTMTAIDSRDPNPTIYYTDDGTAPTVQSTKYTGPITLSQTTVLRYFATDNAGAQESAKGPALYTVQQAFTITAGAGPGGTVAPSGTVIVQPHVDSVFTITPNANHRIVALTVDGQSVNPPTDTYTFRDVSANHTIQATFAPFTAVTVVNPNGGEVLATGSTYTVRYGGPSAAVKYRLEYSTDNGSSYTTFATGAAGYAFTGKVPRITANSTKCRVRATGLTAGGKSVGSDVSDNNFTVEVVRLIGPHGGETIRRGTATPITWTTNETAATVTRVNLAYSTNGGGSWTTITNLAANPGSYTWTVPATINSAACRVRVQLFNGKAGLGSDTSDGTFIISR
jgi:hypothetical protein